MDGEKRGRGMEVGGRGREILYLSLHCHHQNDFCISGWAAMRVILMFHNCEGQSHKTQSVHRPQLLKRKESQIRFEPKSLCLPT